MHGKPTTALGRAVAYLELVKPRSALLLTLTGVGGMLVAAGREAAPSALALLVAALVLGVSGANALSNYIDRDIDARMVRTRRRPIPSGRLPPLRAAAAGMVLVAAGSVVAAMLGPLPMAFSLAGLAVYLLIYSSWLKRISPVNVVLGGLAGGAPVMVGWTAHTGAVEAGALLLAGLVVMWIPHHIWSLALYYAEEYRRVRVPMLPVVVEPRLAARCIGATVVLMYVFSLMLPLYAPLGRLYLAVAAAMGALPTLGGLWLFLRPDRRRAWLLFKLSSPYLAVLCVAMLVDRLA